MAWRTTTRCIVLSLALVFLVSGDADLVEEHQGKDFVTDDHEERSDEWQSHAVLRGKGRESDDHEDTSILSASGDHSPQDWISKRVDDETSPLSEGSESQDTPDQAVESEMDSDDDCEKEMDDKVLPSDYARPVLSAKMGGRFYDPSAVIDRLLEDYESRLPRKIIEDMKKFLSYNTSLFDVRNLARPSIVLNTSNMPVLNITFPSLDSRMNISFLSPLANLSENFSYNGAAHLRSVVLPRSRARKVTRVNEWRCYNGSGIVYGTVQLVSFTVLARFLAHLPCCRTESCRPVAEQGLSRRPLLATACSESSRERFLHIVLCGSVCMIGERVPDLLSSAKKPVSVDWRLFYADDFSSSYSAATPRSSKTNDSSAPLERCQCSVLMIFSPSCPFSVKLSPVYSALARRFPTLPFLAINADLNSSIHFTYGVKGLPTVLLLHKSRERYHTLQFSNWQDLDKMGEFITKHTKTPPVANITVVPSDYESGLPTTVTLPRDYMLIFSTLYIGVLGWFLAIR